LREAFEGGSQGRNKLVIYSYVVFEPEPLDEQRPCTALELRIEPGYQPVLVEYWQCVIAPTPLFGWLIDFPQLLKIE